MSADDLDWDDLRYFLAAARAGTLAGAARALSVEHTTVGRRLAALERAVGAPLVLRGPEGLALTPLGAQVLPAIEQVERSVVHARSLLSRERARVRLAVPSGFTALFVARMAELRARYPELELELVSGARRVDLTRGEAQLAIRIGPLDDQALVARRLGEVGCALYAAHSYLARRPAAIDAHDLQGHDVIGYDPSLAEMPAARWLDVRSRRARVTLRSREMTDMLSAAVSGAGLAVLPCMLGDAEPALCRVTREVIALSGVSLVYRRELTVSNEVRAVIRFVVAVTREQSARIRGTRE